MRSALFLVLFFALLDPSPASAAWGYCKKIGALFGFNGSKKVIVPHQIVLERKSLPELEELLEEILRNGPEARRLLSKIDSEFKNEPRIYEWGIGYDPNRLNYVLVIGDQTTLKNSGETAEAGCVDWGKLASIVPISHSHPPPLGKELKTPPEKISTVEQLLENYGPSGADVKFVATRKLTHHKVLLPFVHTATDFARVANPGTKGPLIHFEITNTKLYGVIQKIENPYYKDVASERQVYITDIITKAGDKTLATTRCISIETGLGRRLIPFPGPFSDFLLKGQDWEISPEKTP